MKKAIHIKEIRVHSSFTVSQQVVLKLSEATVKYKRSACDVKQQWSSGEVVVKLSEATEIYRWKCMWCCEVTEAIVKYMWRCEADVATVKYKWNACDVANIWSCCEVQEQQQWNKSEVHTDTHMTLHVLQLLAHHYPPYLRGQHCWSATHNHSW